MKNWLKQGFTLIELLIVIAIVGILTALVTTNLQGARSRARDIRRKSDMHSIEQSLRLYYNDAKGFPVSSSDYRIEGCGTISTPSTCPWGSAFATATNVYMSSLPIDPSSADTPINYQYFSNDSDEYLLVTQLENVSDQDIANSQSRCGDIYANFNGTKSQTEDYLVCGQ